MLFPQRRVCRATPSPKDCAEAALHAVPRRRPGLELVFLSPSREELQSVAAEDVSARLAVIIEGVPGDLRLRDGV